MDLLNDYFQPEDVRIIRGLAISRYKRPDSYGWSLTESGKYSVKSGYKTKTLFPDNDTRLVVYGPDIKPLYAYLWKLKCNLKLKHFVWQILSGTLPVSKNLKSRGMDCDLRCSLCGADKEIVNHVLFECPPALQVWALSMIPSPPGIFPSLSTFTNMDFLFWRLPKDYDFGYFLWILWYIWKNRNDKLYWNKNGDP